eukprot:COSAG06_NODE_1104_length_10692_cov_20.377041_8_plen_145_part_00
MGYKVVRIVFEVQLHLPQPSAFFMRTRTTYFSPAHAYGALHSRNLSANDGVERRACDQATVDERKSHSRCYHCAFAWRLPRRRRQWLRNDVIAGQYSEAAHLGRDSQFCKTTAVLVDVAALASSARQGNARAHPPCRRSRECQS